MLVLIKKVEGRNLFCITPKKMAESVWAHKCVLFQRLQKILPSKNFSVWMLYECCAMQLTKKKKKKSPQMTPSTGEQCYFSGQALHMEAITEVDRHKWPAVAFQSHFINTDMSKRTASPGSTVLDAIPIASNLVRFVEHAPPLAFGNDPSFRIYEITYCGTASRRRRRRRVLL